MPMTVAALTVGLVFLPTAISIVNASLHGYAVQGLRFLKSYDPIRTAFSLVVLFSLTLATHSVTRLARLAFLSRRLRGS